MNSTVELTRAMYLISTSRIRKAMRLYQSNLLYFTHARRAIKHILSHLPDYSHKYLKESNHSTSTMYLVIAANKGMAGGYNHDVCAAALAHMKQCAAPVTLITVGSMASEFFRREGYEIAYEFTDIIDDPTISAARRMMESITERMDHHKVDEVIVVYTHMISSVKQTVEVTRLLPLLLSDFDDVVYDEDFKDTYVTYEPNAKSVITSLVPQYLLGMLYGMLVQAYASEHCKRMQAMDEATRNADEMIDTLNLAYNSARQAAITQEITEIVSGANAVDSPHEERS